MAKTNAPSQWIPVGVRLPESSKGVLVCYGDTVTVAGYYVSEWMTDDGGMIRPDWVSHWMPLPEPPPVDERSIIRSKRRGSRDRMLEHAKPNNEY
jgi:hypothetical protein